MSKGYRTIETKELSRIYADPKYFEFAVAIFHWLIPQLYEELKDELVGAELEVIQGGYIGAYPILGLYYEKARIDPDRSLDDLVEATATRLLQERPAIELTMFMARDGIDWKAKTAQIMA
ncbi:MAG: hypothetical protein H7175_24140 [Burkholderiales bacterium]|nr:hypothetical protein [Anaerolineae bacterium]